MLECEPLSRRIPVAAANSAIGPWQGPSLSTSAWSSSQESNAHAGTLFSIFVPDVRAAELRPLGAYLCAIVERELRSERLAPDALGSLDPEAVQVAKTASRSVLGFMNDMATHIEYAVATAGGLGRCDIEGVNRQLRRTPYNRGGYLYPIDLVTARANTATGSPRLDWRLR